MLRIRLRRVGKKGKPSYRIVVAEANAPRDGAYVEWIGNYDPMADPPAVSLKNDRAVQWLSQGAQPSDAVRRILDRDGILVRAPRFRAQSQGSEASGSASAPSVTISRVSAPVTALEESAVEESAVEESTAEEPEAPEETVGEESADQAADEQAPEDAPEDETGEEARSE